MILTESDLHAYNRGELSPEATRLLESDPLAMEDAARLRAISAAIRQEATIPVMGRAETLERLRAARAKGIGVPRWVWGVGAACVVGAIAVSLPPSSVPGFRIQRVLYAVPGAPVDVLPESSAGAVVSRSEPKAAEAQPLSTAAQITPRPENQARSQSQDAAASSQSAEISLQTPDLADVGRRVQAEVRTLGGQIVSDQTADRSRTIQARLDPSRIEILRDRLTPDRLAATKEKARTESPMNSGADSSPSGGTSPRSSPQEPVGQTQSFMNRAPSPSSALPSPTTVEITLTTPPNLEVVASAVPTRPDTRLRSLVIGSVALVLFGALATLLWRRSRRA